ncbi:MAG TPA: hypothetical protein PKN57_04280 [Saprospiraceae bacterium]|nr:hypothetical protein [Saprospiraceae bacterium]HMX85405.1 hypothetical protein [Saprospiraceae bacterium]HMZ72884.1 hypothetical protein [Saprospiraceae bacterium]HNA93390.1 hypothetical protein [Saprospiraceae bacterium]HND16610.1 hypothetical protein [Saprospiraceae bacterium]
MKKLQILFLAFILGSVAVTFTSCGSDDPCKDVDCGTNEDCFEGDCICNVGYEQDANGKCTVEQRAKFIGTYTGSETCTTGSDNYTINITTSSSAIDKVIISNVYNQGITLTGTVNKTALTIPVQTITIGALTYTFQGTGTYTAGTPPTILVDYSIQGNPSNACKFNGTKQ